MIDVSFLGGTVFFIKLVTLKKEDECDRYINVSSKLKLNWIHKYFVEITSIFFLFISLSFVNLFFTINLFEYRFFLNISKVLFLLWESNPFTITVRVQSKSFNCRISHYEEAAILIPRIQMLFVCAPSTSALHYGVFSARYKRSICNHNSPARSSGLLKRDRFHKHRFSNPTMAQKGLWGEPCVGRAGPDLHRHTYVREECRSRVYNSV